MMIKQQQLQGGGVRQSASEDIQNSKYLRKNYNLEEHQQLNTTKFENKLSEINFNCKNRHMKYFQQQQHHQSITQNSHHQIIDPNSNNNGGHRNSNHKVIGGSVVVSPQSRPQYYQHQPVINAAVSTYQIKVASVGDASSGAGNLPIKVQKVVGGPSQGPIAMPPYSGINFKQVYSVKNPPQLQQQTLISTNPKKVKLSTIQSGITSSMLRQEDVKLQQVAAKILATQRGSAFAAGTQSQVSTQDEQPHLQQPQQKDQQKQHQITPLIYSTQHRHKKSEGDSTSTIVTQAFASIRSKIVGLNHEQRPYEDSTTKDNVNERAYATLGHGGGGGSRVQSRPPSAHKHHRPFLQQHQITKISGGGSVVVSLDRNLNNGPQKHRVIRERRKASNKTTTECSFTHSSIGVGAGAGAAGKMAEEEEQPQLNQVPVVFGEKTLTKSMVLGSVKSVSNQVSPAEYIPPPPATTSNALNVLQQSIQLTNKKREHSLVTGNTIPVIGAGENVMPQKGSFIEGITQTTQGGNQPPSIKHNSWKKLKSVFQDDQLPQIIPLNQKTPPSKPTLKLLSREYLSYLESYELSLIGHYFEQDRRIQKENSQLLSGYSLHEEISESLRARLIDWVLHCTQVCEMEERKIFFVVVKLVDHFYMHIDQPQPKQELQLTAIASIFIASKLVQINHINLNFCYANIGHNKFSFRQIVDRESQIMNLLDWEASQQPTVYEVFELLMMMVKRRVHGRICQSESETFISDVYNLAIQLLRAQLCSLDSLKRKSVDSASAAIQISLAYHCLELHHKTPQSTSSRKSVGSQSSLPSNSSEVLMVVQAWREVCETRISRTMSQIQPHTVEIAQDVLRIREAMALNPPTGIIGSTAIQQSTHQSRIKEIMQFSDAFIAWASSYVKDQVSTSSSIMRFCTEEEEDEVTDDDVGAK